MSSNVLTLLLSLAAQSGVTFKCYGADVTTSDENFVLCPEP